MENKVLPELNTEQDYWNFIENDVEFHQAGKELAQELIGIFDQEKILITDDCMFDEPYYSLYVGSVFSIFPSGKYYTPYANSNVTILEAAQDQAFSEGLESELDKHGLYTFHGEGDPCDCFIGQLAD